VPSDDRAVSPDADGAPSGAGALPTKQLRSRELRDRLIASGRTLVEAGGFAGTSMAAIARAAGCSTGALYFRFRDKEALFDCVVESVMDDANAQIDSWRETGRYRGLPLEHTIALCVGDYLAFVRGNSGMVRALYQRSLQDLRHLAPLRRTALAMTAVWCDAIAESAGRRDDAGFVDTVRVALQFASGVLVHAVLTEPPFVPLDSEAMAPRLVEMVSGFLQRATGEPAQTSPSSRGRAPGNTASRRAASSP
jgi:AcrR family transcriptional regulator